MVMKATKSTMIITIIVTVLVMMNDTTNSVGATTMDSCVISDGWMKMDTINNTRT